MKNKETSLSYGATLQELLYMKLESLEREAQTEEKILKRVMAKSFHMR